MIFDSSKRIAVLDLTHGGSVIARKLRKITGSVTAVDVYGTMRNELQKELEKENIKTSKEPLDARRFDIIVAPVHLDTGYPMLADARACNIPVVSHHQVVGEILLQYDFKNKRLIEITGTKAKTSTSVLLADILSKKKKVILHTSRGLEDQSTGTIIRKGLSITPASILMALDHLQEKGIDFDILIAEVSLGGTGFADTGIITTISNDYRIANNTRSASDAKRRMILDAKPGSALIVNNDALRFFGACRRDIDIFSFSESINASCNVYYESIGEDGAVIAYFIGKEHGRIHIHESPYYDISSYKTAFACAAAAALSIGIEPATIEQVFCEFEGAEGRMKRKSTNGRTLIDNSNSGMDIITAEKALEYSKKEKGNIVMVIGEEAKEVCEGLDPAGVERFIADHLDDLSSLVLVGERMKGFSGRDPRIHHANDLSSGIELAVSLTHEKDIILSCVKCFR